MQIKVITHSSSYIVRQNKTLELKINLYYMQ